MGGLWIPERNARRGAARRDTVRGDATRIIRYEATLLFPSFKGCLLVALHQT